MSAENLNKRGNPCGLCGRHHGAGPCPHTLAASQEKGRRWTIGICDVCGSAAQRHPDRRYSCPSSLAHKRFSEIEVVQSTALAASQEALRKLEERIDKGHGTSYGDGYMDGLRQGERASQEKERQLREALEQIEQLDRMGHNSEVAAEMGYIARLALDPTQTHGDGERPEGWPDKCANCGADWTQIGYDHALGFNCQSCGGSDADE